MPRWIQTVLKPRMEFHDLKSIVLLEKQATPPGFKWIHDLELTEALRIRQAIQDDESLAA